MVRDRNSPADHPVRRDPGGIVMNKTNVWTGESSLVRGFAWHVYPDPASAGALTLDSPFNKEDTGDIEGTDALVRPPMEPPPGVSAFWTIHGKRRDLINQVEDRAYLVLTESHEPPAVVSGWFVEPARVADGFELDQRGDRSVRLIRTIRTVETEWGRVPECEFQVDRGE